MTFPAPMSAFLFPSHWTFADSNQLVLRSVDHELLSMTPVNISSVINLPALKKDITVKYDWITQPVVTTVGGYMYRFQHQFAAYTGLAWKIFVTCAIIHLWIKVGSLCSNSPRIMSPVLTTLLTAPERVNAMKESEFIHNFIIFCSLLGAIFLLFLLCTILLLCAYFKSYWIRNALRNNHVSGCSWQRVPIQGDAYMPADTATPPAYTVSKSFPKYLPERRPVGIHPDLNQIRHVDV